MIGVDKMSTKENLEQTFKGETTEVGLYLAMAEKAEEEGYPEVALYLKGVAMDEADHACAAAKNLELIGTTKENLQKMFDGEQKAFEMKSKAAEEAQKEGRMDIAGFFRWSAGEEKKHAAGLKAFLDKI